MIVEEQDYLEHVGVSKRDGAPVGSGRYPLGSGENPYQDYRDYKNLVAALKKRGLTEKEIVSYLFDEGYGVTDSKTGNRRLTMRDYRSLNTKSAAEIDAHNYLEAHKLKSRDWSVPAIAKELDVSETTVRKLLARDEVSKSKRINNTAEMLKESLDAKGGYIDIGSGSELWCGVGRSNFDAAVKQLETEGYSIVTYPVRQMFGQGNTTVKVLCPPGTTKQEVYNHQQDIRLPVDVKVDKDGNKLPALRPIQNVDSKRIEVAYAEDGGSQKDGIIELRRGVEDLDLGNVHYAQVRIGVDGTHYLKGIAVYADDLPDGVDIRFNTSKKAGTPLKATEPGGKEVLKPMNDPSNLTNPFGAAIKRGGQRGALNLVNEEGDWSKWSRTLSAQFLSKQYLTTVRKQLKATGDVAQAEFDEIMSLTNPTVKRYLLQEFANSCDSDAVHLKAIRLPGQTQKVLLPLPGAREGECYCPGLADGTEVALVRYPHGGTFEIPVLKVNNNNPDAKRVYGNAMDAIAIPPKAAETLSGADFDGDTAMVLPMSSTKIKHTDPLPGLKDFDAKTQFDGSHCKPSDLMKKGYVQKQMGSITNLITDMTVQGASERELARAVAHSMVVIDAYKHKLDYKASEKYFNIAELRALYQPAREEGKRPGGASTLISRAKSQQRYDERREKAVSKLTPEERARWERGEMIYEPTGKLVWNKQTKQRDKVAQNVGTQMGEVSDAYMLSSGQPVEAYYADYANRMKALANAARAEMRATGKLEYSPTARETYKEEVVSLRAKLNTALMNAPLERKAQTLANATLRVEREDHPEYDDGQLKKAKSRHLEAARDAVGAGKEPVSITDREWEAIQAGAVHDSTVLKILANTKSEDIRARAMPRGTTINSAKVAQARSLLNSGHTWADVAEILGVSVSGLQKAMS